MPAILKANASTIHEAVLGTPGESQKEGREDWESVLKTIFFHMVSGRSLQFSYEEIWF